MVCVCQSLSHVSLQPNGLQPTRLFCPQSSLGKNTGTGLPFLSPVDLPNPRTEPGAPALQADSLPSEPPGKPFSNSIFKYFSSESYNIHLLERIRLKIKLNSLLLGLGIWNFFGRSPGYNYQRYGHHGCHPIYHLALNGYKMSSMS